MKGASLRKGRFMKTGDIHIIISKHTQDMVHIPNGFSQPCCVEPDILKAALRVRDDGSTAPVRLLIFLSIEEIAPLQEVLQGFTSENFMYFFVICGFGRKDGLPLRLLKTVLDYRTTVVTEQEFSFLVDKARGVIEETLISIEKEESAKSNLTDTWNDQEALIRIGKSLSLEKDQAKLLRTILYLSKKIPGADAGSIFLVEEDPDGTLYLRFKYSHTFSRDLAYEDFRMPLNTSSIAGYVAVTGKVLNIPDVYHLDPASGLSFNLTFDYTHGYRTKSMLTVPMRGNLDRIIGVIQLINSKEGMGGTSGNEAYEVRLQTTEDFECKVISFKTRYEGIMEAVAGQAAIAIENNRMFKQIEHQFEEFVKASVTAIESRDPATKGHSFRVASVSVNLARAVNACHEGPLAGIQFSPVQLKELEFAGLLHDFGKVYIDPQIFLKGKKLFPKDMNLLMMRLNFLHRSLELKYSRYDAEGRKLEISPEGAERLQKLKQIIELIIRMNEPTIRNEDSDAVLEKILDMESELSCSDLTGNPIPILTNEEIVNLKIRRGSLNNEERKIIESHVNYTYTFVSRIPWPREYEAIPDIAVAHHEMLDGSGYPNKIAGKENIPIQARIMAIADIFDALIASDRPYKRAIPFDRVISILKEEAERGRLDADLVDLFIESKAWESDEQNNPQAAQQPQYQQISAEQSS